LAMVTTTLCLCYLAIELSDGLAAVASALKAPRALVIVGTVGLASGVVVLEGVMVYSALRIDQQFADLLTVYTGVNRAATISPPPEPSEAEEGTATTVAVTPAHARVGFADVVRVGGAAGGDAPAPAAPSPVGAVWLPAGIAQDAAARQRGPVAPLDRPPLKSHPWWPL
jgi:hypothetical protein